nr:hypothetical protein CFP56_10485 [Quercus suber]
MRGENPRTTSRNARARGSVKGSIAEMEAWWCSAVVQLEIREVNKRARADGELQAEIARNERERRVLAGVAREEDG